jgi:hypothetical protein
MSSCLQEIVASTCMYVFKETHFLGFFAHSKFWISSWVERHVTYKEGRYHILQMEGLLNI